MRSRATGRSYIAESDFIPSTESTGTERDSAICFIIVMRMVSRRVETSCMVIEEVSTGGRTFKKMFDGLPNFQLFFGIQSREPSMTSGRIDTLALMAR